MMNIYKPIALLCLLSLMAFSAQAQDNYEIQVYGAETVAKGHTMLELHSNYTFNGSTQTTDGTFATNHVMHETIEITHGWTPWFETGFYFFNTIGNDGRTGYVGSHIRPRVAVPEEWHWPFGASLSAEFGFQKAVYSASTCSVEVRPILDKKWEWFYLALNPVLDLSLAGADAGGGFGFSPNVKASADVSKLLSLGLEYYGSTEPLFHFDPLAQQQHQLFLATDLNFNDNWEFNAGVGYGFTEATDKCIVKVILGRRF